MDNRIITKSNPTLFDKEVLKMQNALASLPWLNIIYGNTELLTDVKNGRRFTFAGHYIGNGQYTQIAPCAELGNFCFFVIKDPQEVRNRYIVRAPFSLILWYDMRTIGLPMDERDCEQVKSQILNALSGAMGANFSIDRIYKDPKNVFADYSYEHTNNQFLMSPYAGIRIDGTIATRVPCMLGGSFNDSFNDSFDK